MDKNLFNIKLADASDAEYIAEAEESVFSDPWSCSGIAHFCDCSSAFVICSNDENGDLSGYAVGSFAAGEGELLRIAVLPDHRGKGLGKALLSKFLSEMRTRNVSTVFLEVRVSNEHAISLYESTGFESYTIRRNYYKNPAEDAVMMRLDLDI